jgi:hypothetical protein
MIGRVRRDISERETRPAFGIYFVANLGPHSFRDLWRSNVPDPKEIQEVPKSPESPLVFISHDSRDADLAEAFSKLLKSVSAGMLKSFRSSDKKGTEGIEFGDEWYKILMSKLDKASDVVCLLTERSLDRPWILYEAGVAKGKLGTPVHGIALGVPLSRVSAGPFYQFQNSDDSKESLAKLVLQLCRRIANLEPDQDVVSAQVQAFKATVADVLETMGGQKHSDTSEAVDEGSVAKVLEEMKLIVRELPQRLEEQMTDGPERFRGRRRFIRRLHPEMIDEMAHLISKRSDDPVGVLIIASLVRDDFPWLYEIGLEAYRGAKSTNLERAHDALRRFRDSADATLHGPWMEEMGIGGKEAYMAVRDIPILIDRYMHRFLERRSGKRNRLPAVVRPKEEDTGS